MMEMMKIKDRLIFDQSDYSLSIYLETDNLFMIISRFFLPQENETLLFREKC